MIGSATEPDDELVITLSTPPGKAALLEDLSQGEQRQRRQLGGLPDHRAARRDRGTDLAGAHRGREVPGRDEEAGPDRLAHDEDSAGARCPPSCSCRRFAGPRPRTSGRTRPRRRSPPSTPPTVLPISRVISRRELVGALVQRLEGAPEDLAALVRRASRPTRPGVATAASSAAVASSGVASATSQSASPVEGSSTVERRHLLRRRATRRRCRGCFGTRRRLSAPAWRCSSGTSDHGLVPRLPLWRCDTPAACEGRRAADGMPAAPIRRLSVIEGRMGHRQSDDRRFGRGGLARGAGARWPAARGRGKVGDQGPRLGTRCRDEPVRGLRLRQARARLQADPRPLLQAHKHRQRGTAHDQGAAGIRTELGRLHARLDAPAGSGSAETRATGSRRSGSRVVLRGAARGQARELRAHRDGEGPRHDPGPGQGALPREAQGDGGRRRAAGGQRGRRSMPTCKGVVPNEVPSSWPQAALRAQAVAARSYALATSGGGAFDVYDDTRSQVYGGKGSETARTNKATKRTDGEVVNHGGRSPRPTSSRPRAARPRASSSASRGRAGPYLKAVKDPYDGASPYHRWRVRYSRSRDRVAALRAVLGQAAEDQGHEARQIAADRASARGRVPRQLQGQRGRRSSSSSACAAPGRAFTSASRRSTGPTSPVPPAGATTGL